MKRKWIVFMFSVFVLLASACGQTGNATSDQELNHTDEQDIIAEELNLETLLEAEQDGKALTFDLSLTNHGEKAVDLSFSSGQQFEIVVTDQEGNELYRYSEGKAFTLALQTITLEAGESLEWEDRWEFGDTVDHSQTVDVEAIVIVMEEEGIGADKQQLRATQQVELEHIEGNETTESGTEEPKENSAFRHIEVEGSGGHYVVTGEARVFEGVFGYAVTEGHFYYEEEYVQVKSGAPTWSPFEIDIQISEKDLPKNGTITLELFEESAKDGEKTNTLVIPLEAINKP